MRRAAFAAAVVTLWLAGSCNVEPLTAESLYGRRDPLVASIAGLVTDVRSGAPLGGATASATGVTVMTDASGAYLLDLLAPGAADLSVARVGYETATYRLMLIAGEVTTRDVALVPIPCATTGCGIDDFCNASTGRCEPRTGAASATGVVRDACTGAPLSARVTAARRSTCSSDDGKSFWQLTGLPAGGPQILAAAKGGYKPYATEVTLLAGFNTPPPIELQPEAGCASPMPTDIPCTCADPQCQ